ncbi:MAG: 16S rRNA (guanine(527)-N(7))-methyltransferase RsmG [Gammaproteobacteria bacterium]
MQKDPLKESVETGLQALELPLPGRAVSQLLDYLRLLEKWNKVYNLTAVRQPGEMVCRHLMDSLSVTPWLRGKSVADVGTGGGLPGVPLAIARPDLCFTLIDSSGKKTRFLKHALGKLALDNVSVAQCRVEDYDGAPAFDTVISRAFSTVGDFVLLAGHLCRPGGRLLAMKGVAPVSDSAQLPEGWSVEEIHKLEVPGLNAERHLLLVSQLPPGETE